MYIGTVTAAHLLSHIISGPPQLNGVSDDETLGSDVDSLKSCDIDVTISWRHQIPASTFSFTSWNLDSVALIPADLLNAMICGSLFKKALAKIV
jgi:hypothetical protein